MIVDDNAEVKQMTRTIPDKMDALQLRVYEGVAALTLAQKAVPRPGRGQVLVRMVAAPVNPSDLSFLEGHYGVTKRLPVVPGFEGSGTVVAAGPGLFGRLLLGRRVACAAHPREDGSWAGYMRTRATMCAPLLKEVSLEQGATPAIKPCFRRRPPAPWGA
jgi:NADPH:quinone reductase-like Zn-dependent oxidoreductase